MTFIDKFGQALTNAGQETATKAKNFADISRLNSSINTLNQEINQLTLDLGRAYYERHKNDYVFLEEPERMTSIRNAYEEISRYQEQIDQIRGVERCQSCGVSNPAGSTFCSSCGAKIIKSSPATQEGKLCPQCHASVGDNDSFCMSCGAKLHTNPNDNEV